MGNPELSSADPMRQLKDAKFALSAGHAKQAYEYALSAVHNARLRDIPRIEAMGLHRVGSAQEALGFHSEAERSMELSHFILSSLRTPDYLAQGIVERDIALIVGEQNRSEDGHTEAVNWHERAITSHEMAYRNPSAKASRAMLELATTAAFGNRLLALENRFDHSELWKDVAVIRDLRHHTKPTYELDALDWATRYERSTVKITKALPRAAFLSLQVGNPFTPIRMNTRPVGRFISNRLDS